MLDTVDLFKCPWPGRLWGGKLTMVSLLNGRGAKLPCQCLCINPYIGTALSLHWSPCCLVMVNEETPNGPNC